MCNEQLRLFAASIDIGAIQETVERIMLARYAPNTLRNYRCSWGSFQNWCRDADRKPLPATPQTCIDHAAWCIGQKLRLETVHLRLKAINHYHRQAKLPLPFDAAVREFLRNARRALAERPQGKDALSPEQLKRICQLLRRRNQPNDIRDRALILLGFAAGWRSAEIVSLELRDLRWVEKGITLQLGKSKTDQEGKGRVVGIQPGGCVSTCPIAAIRDWLGIRRRWPGPLFAPFDGQMRLLHEPLHKDAVRRAVKRGLELIGENADRYGSHSLRSGMVTASIEAGASETAIMQRTGQKSYTTLGRYVRKTRLFRSNPLAGVL